MLGIRNTLEFVETERLELIPATIELCEAETRGLAALEACFQARVRLLASTGIRA